MFCPQATRLFTDESVFTTAFRKWTFFVYSTYYFADQLFFPCLSACECFVCKASPFLFANPFVFVTITRKWVCGCKSYSFYTDHFNNRLSIRKWVLVCMRPTSLLSSWFSACLSGRECFAYVTSFFLLIAWYSWLLSACECLYAASFLSNCLIFSFLSDSESSSSSHRFLR